MELATNIISYGRAKTKMYILKPALWSNFPWFPVKRYREENGFVDIEVGVVFAGEKKRVFLANLFLLPRDKKLVDFMKESPQINYGSLDELLDDGWLGD